MNKRANIHLDSFGSVILCDHASSCALRYKEGYAKDSSGNLVFVGDLLSDREKYAELLEYIDIFIDSFTKSVARVDSEVVVNPNEAHLVMPIVELFVNEMIKKGFVKVNE